MPRLPASVNVKDAGYCMADLAVPATAWAATLRRRTQTHVAISSPQPATFAAMLLGALAAGKVAVLPTHNRLAFLAPLAGLSCLLVGDWPAARLPLRRPDQADLQRAATAPSAAVALRRQSPAARLVLFTSGSTGKPQALRKCLRTLLAEAAALEACFGARLGDAPLRLSAPHQHIYGLLYGVIWPLWAGRPAPAWRQRLHGVCATLCRQRQGPPACLFTTPGYLRALQRAGGPQPAARLLMSAGAPLPTALARWAERAFGCVALDLFGSTETGGIGYREAARHRHLLPFPGVRWRCVEGRLRVRSPFTQTDGEQATQDRACPTADGRGFGLLGRADRIVQLGDKPVNLAALQRHLEQEPAVAAAALVVGGDGGLHIGLELDPPITGTGWAAQIARLRARLLQLVDRAAVPATAGWHLLEAPPPGLIKWSEQALRRHWGI